MTKTCSKKNYLVTNKDDIKQIIKDAYEIANSGQKGPVVIALPRNILESKYTQKLRKNLYKKKPQKIAKADIDKTIKMLKSANKPLLLLGGGSAESVDLIRNFVTKTNIPVVSTLMGIGVFPSKEDNYLGMIGINGTNSANLAIDNSDLVIALGVSFSDRSTCRKENFTKNAKIININTQKSSLNFGLEITTSSNIFLKELISKIPETINFTEWAQQVSILKKKNAKDDSSSKCLHSSCVLKTIYELTRSKNPIVVTDVGQHQMLTAQHFYFSQPNKFITSGGLGTMGFGLPASIGAQLATPGSLVLNITGDGSFQMNLQELATCREHNIPIKIIIMNNGFLGMVRQMQEKIYNSHYQVEMTNPDFTKIAEAYDLFAIRVKSSEELIPALNKAFSHNGTAIVDIAINSRENI